MHRESEQKGNKKMKERLARMFMEKHSSHAFLFFGPRAVGKATYARELARAYVGDHHESIYEISPYTQEKQSIDVATIRLMKRSMGMGQPEKPRVGIVDDAHAMSIAAQNAFLKLLEEPNLGVKFILITPFAGGVLETIQSRCQQFSFSPVETDEMMALASELFPRDRVQEMVELACGRPGWLVRMSLESAFLEARRGAGKIFPLLAKRSIRERLAFAQKLAEDKDRMIDFLERWVEYMRRTSREQSRGVLVTYEQIERVQKAIEGLQFGTSNSRLIAESLLVDMEVWS